MASRYASVTESEIAALASNSKNANTQRSTRLWLNVFIDWANFRGKNTSLEKYSQADLDITLCQFYSEVRKQDGGDYEPDCLRVMQSSLQRYLTEQQYNGNILSDMAFSNSRNVLEGKARKLRAIGMGKRPHASHALSKAEEEILWECGRLGDGCPTSLVRTMWYHNIQHFGLRGVQEHTSMTMENFMYKVDEEGVQYIEFSEDPTKTRQNGLHPKNRVSNTKMFPVGGARCPVRLFKLYVSKRPLELRDTGRFYLTPKQDKFQLNNHVWYVKNPMGKNTISGIMKSLISGTEVENAKKNLTNHSGRKTLVKKLKSATIPETSIIKVTGHKTTAGLRNYDPEDETEFRNMSNAVQGSTSSSSASANNHNVDFQVSSPSRKRNSCASEPEVFSNQKTRSFNPFNPFDSIFQDSLSSSSLHHQPVYNFYSCNVTITSAPTSTSIKCRRKRMRIYSSSEDDSSQS